MVRAWFGWLPWVHDDPAAVRELAELRAERESMRAAKQSAAERLTASESRWADVNQRSSAIRARLERNHIGRLIEDAIRPVPRGGPR